MSRIDSFKASSISKYYWLRQSLPLLEEAIYSVVNQVFNAVINFDLLKTLIDHTEKYLFESTSSLKTINFSKLLLTNQSLEPLDKDLEDIFKGIKNLIDGEIISLKKALASK